MTAPDERAHDLVVPESDPASPPETAWVLPENFISRCTSVVLLLCAYSVLCIFLPTALGTRANPAVMPTGGKPPWDLLFLYEYTLRVPSFVGALTPVLLLALLAALPFVDRNPSRDPRKRVLGLLLAGATVAAVLTLTILGWGR